MRADILLDVGTEVVGTFSSLIFVMAGHVPKGEFPAKYLPELSISGRRDENQLASLLPSIFPFARPDQGDVQGNRKEAMGLSR